MENLSNHFKMTNLQGPNEYLQNYVKGNDNVVADALSRITLQDIKEIPRDPKQILVTTRAMTRKTELAETKTEMGMEAENIRNIGQQ